MVPWSASPDGGGSLRGDGRGGAPRGLHPFLARLHARRSDLSPLHRRIVDFFLTRPDEAVYATTTGIGRELGVSEASVVRCCRRLGFRGFRDFQGAFRQVAREPLSRVSRVELVAGKRRPMAALIDDVIGNDIENLRATQGQLDHGLIVQVAEMLWAARSIHVVGVRSAHSIAVFLHFALKLLGRRSHLLTPGMGDVPEQIVDVGRGDVVLGITFERYARTTVELFDACVARGAVGVAITDKPTSPLTDHAKVILMCRTHYLTFIDSYVAPLSLANAILSVLAVRRRRAATASLARMEEAWEMMSTYR
jgi:DNA-binding MurR/RpiR family transcriptional regulator